MAITDSQVHIQGADTPDRPRPRGRASQAPRPCAVTKALTLFTEELPWRKGAVLEAVTGLAISPWLGGPEDT